MWDHLVGSPGVTFASAKVPACCPWGQTIAALLFKLFVVVERPEQFCQQTLDVMKVLKVLTAAQAAEPKFSTVLNSVDFKGNMTLSATGATVQPDGRILIATTVGCGFSAAHVAQLQSLTRGQVQVPDSLEQLRANTGQITIGMNPEYVPNKATYNAIFAQALQNGMAPSGRAEAFSFTFIEDINLTNVRLDVMRDRVTGKPLTPHAWLVNTSTVSIAPKVFTDLTRAQAPVANLEAPQELLSDADLMAAAKARRAAIVIPGASNQPEETDAERQAKITEMRAKAKADKASKAGK